MTKIMNQKDDLNSLGQKETGEVEKAYDEHTATFRDVRNKEYVC